MRWKLQVRHLSIMATLGTALVTPAYGIEVADSWEAEQLKQHGIQACVPDGASTPDPMRDYRRHTLYRGDNCDDGRYCNGQERCSGSQRFRVGDEQREVYVCESTGAPCRNDEVCDNSRHRCLPGSCDVMDADGDGHVRMECGGDDCDDSNANRFPGNSEVCDAEGVDEDCNPATYGNKDSDGDGFVDAMCFNYQD